MLAPTHIPKRSSPRHRQCNKRNKPNTQQRPSSARTTGLPSGHHDNGPFDDHNSLLIRLLKDGPRPSPLTTTTALPHPPPNLPILHRCHKPPLTRPLPRLRTPTWMRGSSRRQRALPLRPTADTADSVREQSAAFLLPSRSCGLAALTQQ